MCLRPFPSLSKYLDGTRPPAQVHQAVTADVHRAARLIDTGLNSFAAWRPGRDGDGPTGAQESAR